MSKNSGISIRYNCKGASRTVTGSCHLLEIYVDKSKYNIVIDYGMVQNNLMKMNELYKTNKKAKSIRWDEVDTIILTHSHADHCALTPVAVMNGFKGDIICTEPTIRLTELILSDSAFIQSRDSEKYNKTKDGKKNPIYPIYGQRHVEETMSLFKGYGYDRKIILNNNISVTLKSAGHLLGASSPYIEVVNGEEKKRLLFTGDTSANKKIPFIKSPNLKDLKVDYLFTEGTYGDKLHKKSNVKSKLKKSIKEIVNDKNGKLVIPVFAVGRSSSVIKYLYEIINGVEGFNDVEIYLCSPMAGKAHRIYGHEDSLEFYDGNKSETKDIFRWDRINYIEDYKILEKEVLNKKPMIVLCSSGMVTGGYSNAIISGMLPHENSKILFCGYQGVGSTGRNILDSEFGEQIHIDGKDVQRKCEVDFMSLSSHADYKDMIKIFSTMRHTKIKHIFLNHGDEEVLSFFRQELDNVFNAKVEVSDYDKWYKLN